MVRFLRWLVLALVVVSTAKAGTLLSVGIALNHVEVTVKGNHGLRLLDPESGREWTKSWGERPVKLIWDRASKQVTSPDLEVESPKGILLRPMLGGRVLFHGKEYRGQILVRPDPSGGFSVINLVDLEDYLLGVLPKELSPSAPMEALKAQAVASRTYALKHARDFAKRGFGLKATEGSQVYHGVQAEHPRSTKAVQSTAGKVLKHKGKLIHAWFSASCGGRTSANEAVWNGHPRSYARPVACGYCRIFPSYHWSAEVSYEEITKRLKDVARPVGEVKEVKFLRSKTGRVTQVEIKGSKKKMVLTGNEFRILAGHRLVRSLRFVTKDDPVGEALDGITAANAGVSDEDLIQKIIAGEVKISAGEVLHLEGTGYGHGVGFCQWGARGMAEEGYDWEAILSHYYTGARLSQDTRSSQIALTPGPEGGRL